MYSFEVTPELLVALVAGLLALVFEYFPGLAQWFEQKPEAVKKQIMLGLLVLCSAVIFVGVCVGWFVTSLTCELKSAFDLLYMIFIAITVNQGVHRLVKK